MAADIELDERTVYEIRVRGELDARWGDWFGDLTVTVEREDPPLTRLVSDLGCHRFAAQARGQAATLSSPPQNLADPTRSARPGEKRFPPNTRPVEGNSSQESDGAVPPEEAEDGRPRGCVAPLEGRRPA